MSKRFPKTWTIEMPIAGAVCVTVEAETREAAIEAAVLAAEEWLGSKPGLTDTESVQMMELNAYATTGRGNVTHLAYSEACVVEMSDPDEEDQDE